MIASRVVPKPRHLHVAPRRPVLLLVPPRRTDWVEHLLTVAIACVVGVVVAGVLTLASRSIADAISGPHRVAVAEAELQRR